MDANTNITTTISETRPHLAIFGRKLIIDQVNHYVEFNEYPQTSETGVATVYDVSAWEPEEARKAFALKNIQYSIGDPGNKKSIFSNCQFLGVDTTKEYRTCQGVKACEYASQELHTPHTEVDFEGQLFKRLFDAHEYSISKQTLGKFVAAHNTLCPYLNPETNQYCTGSPKLCEHNQIDGMKATFFIGCTEWRAGEHHRYIRIEKSIDIEYLQRLFRDRNYYPRDRISNDVVIDGNCFMVLPTNSQIRKCPFPHEIGNDITEGRIKRIGCKVKFYHFTPIDLKECPYIVIVSVGKHTHLPPPPSKPPITAVENLNKIMNNEDLLDLTARKLLTKPALKIYLNGAHISTLHPSFNKQSRLNYLIGKAKRTKYPFGQDIYGVISEFSRNHRNSENPYIRHIHFYETGQILIICMTAYQSRQLQQLKSFEIDASFKRVQGVIKEWEINAFIERYNKTLPFARVFTDVETANAYEHVFTEVFSIVENDVGHRLKFHHIDGEGVQKIVADAHEGQAKGLGLYLHKIDPSRTTTEHLEHIYQTCIVHYNRNIRNKKIPEEVKKMMYAIPNQETEAQVQLLLYQIESSEIPEAINWVRDKRDPWMLASISLVYSKMSREVWNLPPHNTNASESAHANINLDGKSLSLLSAILKGRDFDYHQWQTIETLEQYNIGDSINNSLVYRQTAAARRSQKRKVIRNTPTRRTRRMTTQHQSVGSEEPTLNSVNVSVNIDVEAEERRNELLRERVQMTRELLNMEKELSQIRNQQ